MIILGIDPGYAILGWGVIEKTGNHFRAIDYGAVTTDKDMDMLVYHISLDKYTSNKQIREWLEVDRNTASKVIAALRKAGYVGDEHSNYIIPVYITTEVYFRLRGDLH